VAGERRQSEDDGLLDESLEVVEVSFELVLDDESEELEVPLEDSDELELELELDDSEDSDAFFGLLP
jgi:hypothetical protein